MAFETINKKWRPRGPVLFGLRDETTTPAGPGIFGESHCVDQVSMALTIEYLTHDAKCGTVDAEDARQIKKASGEVSFDFSNFTPEALLLALDAVAVDADVSPVAVVDEALPIGTDDDPLTEGDKVILGGANPNFNITSLVIEDSATVPATLVANTDYVLDAKFGMVQMGDISTFTLPLKASYSHQNPKALAALKAGTLVRWVRFNGINPADGNKLSAVDMFKIQLSPTSAFDLLPDDFGKLTLKGAIQIDLSRETTDPLGQFFSANLA